MASIYEKDPVYITLANAKASSTTLNALADGKIKEFLYKSQKMIDAYIVQYGEKTISAQEFIFPVNGSAEIPADIQEACVELAEYLAKGGNSVKDGVSEVHEGDTTIKYDPKIVSTAVKVTFRKISKYRRNSFKIIP